MKLGNNLDFAKLEAQNVRIQNLASDPGTPVLGQIYYNTSTNRLRVCIDAGTPTWLQLDDLTAAEVLALILTVDGAGSNLDADLLDAQNGTYYLARTNH